MEKWFLYVLECERGVLYTGISPDVEKRFALHASGKGAIFTRINKPVRILGVQEFPDRSSATKAEAALKKLPKEAKLRRVMEMQPHYSSGIMQ